MRKTQAIELLGGTTADAAREVGVTSQAISQWPDELPPRITDRVLAALARKHLPPGLIGADGAPPVAIDTPAVPKAVEGAA